MAGMVPIALSIAGSDPSGGAGIQADLKTFHQHGCYGCAVTTLITVQNTRRVKRVEILSAELVAGQLETILEDIEPGAAKTGALGSAGVVEAVAERLAAHPLPLVVDPVLKSKHGAVLADNDALRAIISYLLPHTLLVTPNLQEAQLLTGRSIDIRNPSSIRDAARAVAGLGPKAVLIKGGHLLGDAVDTLYANGEFHQFIAPRIDSPHTHGVGCTLSAAITANIGKGRSLIDAVGNAKKWLTRAIAAAPGVGSGICAVDHHASLDESVESS